MRVFIFLALSLIALLARPVAAEDAQDADNLEKLRAQCEKVLPEGWIAELATVNPNHPTQRGECPAVVVRTAEPIELEYAVPNATAGQGVRRVTEPAAI